MNPPQRLTRVDEARPTAGAIAAIVFFLMSIACVGLTFAVPDSEAMPWIPLCLAFSTLVGIRQHNAQYLVALAIRHPWLRVLFASVCILLSLCGIALLGLVSSGVVSKEEGVLGRVSPMLVFAIIGGLASFGYLARTWLFFGLGREGSMPFLVEIANGSIGSCYLFEAAFQVRLQRTAQADQLLAAAHFA